MEEREKQRQEAELNRERHDRERRKKNVILFGVHETNKYEDVRIIKDILAHLGCQKRLKQVNNKVNLCRRDRQTNRQSFG